jgi:hypothetical protein
MNSITYKHTKYLTIALRHATELEKKAAKYKNVIDLAEIKWKWWQQRQMKKNIAILQECCEHNDIIITMCAFTLEAFINFYAIHFGIDQQPGYDEKQNTKKKWRDYPMKVTGNQPDDVFINRIQKIMDDRNSIGHYKSQRNETIYSEFSMEDAFRNLNEVYQIFEDFKAYDPQFKFTYYQFEIPKYAKGISMQYNVFCNHHQTVIT